MGKRSAAEEKAVAHHEAGHIVIAYFLEIPLAKGEVTIVPDDKSAGSFRSGVALSRLDLDWGNSDAVRKLVERCVQMCLAGVMAQQRYLPSSVRAWHGINDLRFAADLIGLISCDREVVQPYIDILRVRTQLMFEDPLKWKCVQAIATALIEKRTLSLRDATGIVEATNRRYLEAAHASASRTDAPSGRNTIPLKYTQLARFAFGRHQDLSTTFGPIAKD